MNEPARPLRLASQRAHKAGHRTDVRAHKARDRSKVQDITEAALARPYAVGEFHPAILACHVVEDGLGPGIHEVQIVLEHWLCREDVVTGEHVREPYAMVHRTSLADYMAAGRRMVSEVGGEGAPGNLPFQTDIFVEDRDWDYDPAEEHRRRAAEREEQNQRKAAGLWPYESWDHVHEIGAYPEEVGRGCLGAILQNLPGPDGQTLLDYGCGTGLNTSVLASLGYKVVGQDTSEVAIAQARKRFPDIEFRVGPKIDGEFDLSIASLVYQYAEMPDTLARVLAHTRHTHVSVVVRPGEGAAGMGNLVRQFLTVDDMRAPDGWTHYSPETWLPIPFGAVDVYERR